MTINQFRSYPKLVDQWNKELQTNTILQQVLAVLDDNHPAKDAVPGDANDDVSPTRAAIELGATRGYSKYQVRLKILAVQLPGPTNVGETTYAEPPVEENPNA